MTIFTIGFTKSSAEHFFGRLRSASVKRIVDIRLSNLSQLAGFTKKEDLKYFARELCGVDYLHLLDLAPTAQLMDDYKKHHLQWEEFERRFAALLRERKVEKSVDPAQVDRGALLCSEQSPQFCHRRIVAEYLAARWPKVEIVHL